MGTKKKESLFGYDAAFVVSTLVLSGARIVDEDEEYVHVPRLPAPKVPRLTVATAAGLLL